MKKLMILGAGIYQVPLIKKAKEMGLYTIVVSYKGNYPGFKYADCVYEFDTTDYEAILKVARKEEINGICTAGTDVAVKTIGIVCEDLGLQGLSKEAADTLTNKSEMKTAFVNGSVNTAVFEKVNTFEQVEQAVEKMRLPVVIKAVDTSGSRGVTIVKEYGQLRSAYESAIDNTKQNYVLVEDYIEGTEIGLDGFVQGGEVKGIYPHEKFVCHAQGSTIPSGHAFPLNLSVKQALAVKKQMELAILSTKLNNSAFNADIFLVGEDAYLIEMGGRSGATCIPELITIHTGCDYYEAIIRNALGEKLELKEMEKQPVMGRLLFSTMDGTIKDIDKEKLNAISNDGIEVKLDYQIGDSVEKVRNGTSRIGHVIMKTTSIQEIEEIIEKTMSCITIEEE